MATSLIKLKQLDISCSTPLEISSDAITISKEFIEYIDLLYKILGYDVTFEKYKQMSNFEKMAMFRDIKINNITK